MKASSNICSCSQVLGQCLKYFWCFSYLQRQTEAEKRTGKPTSYIFVLTEHPNWVEALETSRSFHGATPQRFLWLNCSIRLSQKNRERLVENTVCIFWCSSQDKNNYSIITVRKGLSGTGDKNESSISRCHTSQSLQKAKTITVGHKDEKQ